MEASVKLRVTENWEIEHGYSERITGVGRCLRQTPETGPYGKIQREFRGKFKEDLSRFIIKRESNYFGVRSEGLGLALSPIILTLLNQLCDLG